ncbi:GntR family transcriptional regulator [Kitasatospora sp. NPDC057223]|uniref:GntR family transcriptional regulator n=1 Tax=Kitasatospora sp. NPDC057223 TaxID=3346055 RepID=UPI00362D4B5E
MSTPTPASRAPQRNSGPAPLWAQTADLIVDEIERLGLSAGGKLPAERELCATLDISRVTLRKALLHLVEQGVVTSSHGRGWFVAAAAPAREWPNNLESFSATAHRKHMRPSSIVLRNELQAASLDEAERLGVPAGTPLLRLDRVRLLNDVRIAVDRTAVPEDLADGLDAADFTTASLFEELRRHGVELDRSVATVEARSADETLAGHLQIAPGAPVLVLDQTIYTRDQRPALLTVVEYSGERYRLRTTFQPR